MSRRRWTRMTVATTVPTAGADRAVYVHAGFSSRFYFLPAEPFIPRPWPLRRKQCAKVARYGQFFARRPVSESRHPVVRRTRHDAPRATKGSHRTLLARTLEQAL